LEVGRRRPPHAGASSKILMAYLPEEEIQAIIRDKGLPKVCTNTITDPDELMAELAKIRACGYAESREETDLGACSRFTDQLVQQYVILCRQAAQRISALLSKGIEA